MNYELFIAKHILKRDNLKLSGPYVLIAVIAISLGLATMIISIAIVTGFQQEIRNKVVGFGSHIQITNYDFNKSFEASPISKYQDFYPEIDTMPGIDHIQVFANKAGIIKTEHEIQGIVLKGIDKDYNWNFFKNNIIDGEILQISDSVKTNEIIISKKLANKLLLDLHDEVRVYFITDGSKQPRGRKFFIKGIYETGLEEFDELYVIGDIKHIQKLNNWNEGQVAGFELIINDFDNLNEIAEKVSKNIGYDLKAQTIKDQHPQIFDWLNVQDMNVIVIIVLMILVSSITMISTLLVLILERANMIGILKALGAKTWSIRNIFFYHSVFIIGQGMIWGNIIGIGFSVIQKYTGIIPLSEESYYVSVVPIHLDIGMFALINIGTLLICTLMLIVPSYIVSQISPIKAIRFD